MNFNSFYNESILDVTRSGLDPTVFSIESGRPPILHSSIKDQILNDIVRFQALIQLNKIYLIGSMLTRNYNRNSDLDVTIEVNKEDIDQDTGIIGVEKIIFLLKSLNGKMAVGTTHPINYYITTNFDEQNADSIYDIETDTWIKETSVTDVDVQGYMKKFTDLVSSVDLSTGELRRDLIDYNELKEIDEYSLVNVHSLLNKKLYEINKNIEELINLKIELKSKRKDAFDSPMTPKEILKYSSKNKLPANVIYKLFQKYYYFDLINKLEEIIKNRDSEEKYIDKIDDLLSYKESLSLHDFYFLDEKIKKFKAGKYDWKSPKSIRKYRDRRFRMDTPQKQYIKNSELNIHQSHRNLGLSKKVVDIAKKSPSGIWRLTPLQVKEIAMKYHHIPPNNHDPIKHLGNTGIVVWRKGKEHFYLVKHRKFR
jgi:predicted nucleotidyltransferase